MTENNIESYSLKILLRDGDHDAYREIFIHYWKPVLQFLRHLVRSDEMAKEITQEIFVVLWEKRERVDPAKSLKSYLFTIARNTAIKHFDHQKVSDKHEAWLTNQHLEHMPVDSELMSEEMRLLTEIAINRMPSKQRKVMELSFKEGLNADQIAELLDINKATVATYLSVARKELKELLSKVMFFFV